MYVVYGLEDQRNHEIFYVGITDDIQARFLQHLRCDGSNPMKDARIQDMLSAGYLPLSHTLQIVAHLDRAKQRESYWIRHYHALDMPLTNQVIPVIPEHIVIARSATGKYKYRIKDTSALSIVPEGLERTFKKVFTLKQEQMFLDLYKINRSIKQTIRDMHISYGDYQAYASYVVRKNGEM